MDYSVQYIFTVNKDFNIVNDSMVRQHYQINYRRKSLQHGSYYQLILVISIRQRLNNIIAIIYLATQTVEL